MTRGFWRDPSPLRGDVLVADPRDVAPRRLGEHRRGRVLVHPRPLRRHAQGRRQARRAGRGRERGRRRIRPCSRRPRSASRTRSRARSSSSSCVLRPGETDDDGAARLDRADGRGAARQAAQARGRGGRPGPAQDPLRQGHAPGGPGRLAGPGPGRLSDPRRPADARGDPRGGVTGPGSGHRTNPVGVVRHMRVQRLLVIAVVVGLTACVPVAVRPSAPCHRVADALRGRAARQSRTRAVGLLRGRGATLTGRRRPSST